MDRFVFDPGQSDETELDRAFKLQRLYKLEHDLAPLVNRQAALSKWNPRALEERKLLAENCFGMNILGAGYFFLKTQDAVGAIVFAAASLFAGARTSAQLLVSAGFLFAVYNVITPQAALRYALVMLALSFAVYALQKLDWRTRVEKKVRSQELARDAELAALKDRVGLSQQMRDNLQAEVQGYDFYRGKDRTPENIQDIIDILVQGRARTIDSAADVVNADIDKRNAVRHVQREAARKAQKEVRAWQMLSMWNAMDADAARARAEHEADLRRRGIR